MVLNMVVYLNFGNLCGKCRQRRGKLDCCSSLFFVSFPTGDNLLCYLVKMTKVIICLFYRSMPFSGAFLVEWQRKVHLAWVTIFYSDR